jgi:hypothetical protein
MSAAPQNDLISPDALAITRLRAAQEPSLRSLTAEKQVFAQRSGYASCRIGPQRHDVSVLAITKC